MKFTDIEVVYTCGSTDTFSLPSERAADYVKCLSKMPNVVTIGKIDRLVVEVLY